MYTDDSIQYRVENIPCYLEEFHSIRDLMQDMKVYVNCTENPHSHVFQVHFDFFF